VDDDDISIYMLEELERLESLQVQEFIHTHVYDVNLLKKGEMCYTTKCDTMDNGLMECASEGNPGG
jgi:hypothetical protein